ncbi:unnamed protein product [Sphenostylis stenocarpa]|uniref:Uncharacterized protein n=1 Tax=Sphenostylis stenocarpa TaxID=92480 RepID=A0AA87B9Z6_9FABA|nr:unnamed protein product [Sphenostylis stenocarpa]
MDSIPNISLLDEDDLLLFDDSAAATADVFSCSPLIPLKSNPPHTEGCAADFENRSSSVNEGANKENADWNKQQKLSLEPQQMKRKKKGGGYNLRKSVLNPVELSMISGTASAKAGLNLEMIHEEEYVGTSIKLQEIEENYFMQSSSVLPAVDRKIGATARFSPKPAALAKASPVPVSLAKRKILTVNDSVGNRPKRNACPSRLPVASSSYPCHCLPDTVKAPSKEVKVATTRGPKVDVSASATTSRSGMLTAGFSNRNQNANPATNVQKHSGVKALSKNPKTVPSNPKVGPADKSSVTRTLAKQAGKHLDNSVSETHPPPGMLQSGTEANKVSEACLPQAFSDIGEKKQLKQLQTTKLSGLRMPSPSLGFFSMAKAPSPYSQFQKISKPSKPAKTNIPKLQNLETNSVNDASVQHAPGIRSEIVKGAAKNCSEELSLLDVKSELRMQVDNKHIAGVKVEYNSLCSENVHKEEKVEKILQHVNIKSKEQGELHRRENVSTVEDEVFPRREKELLSESHTLEQLEKEAVHPDVLSNGYQSVLQEPQSMQYHGIQGTSIVKGSISNTVQNGTGQDERTKLLVCDAHTSNESLVLQAKHSTSFKDSRFSGEFNEYSSVNTALLNSSPIDFSETILEGSMQEITSKRNAEQVNGGASDFIKSGGEAQEHLLNGNLSVNCNEITESKLEAVNQQLHGEQLKSESESHVNSCQLVHMRTLSSKCSPQKSITEIKYTAASEPKIANIEGCQLSVDGQSGFIQTIPVLEQCDKVIVLKEMGHSTEVFQLDRLSEDRATVSAITCNTAVGNVSKESRHFHENNVQNIHLTSQVFPMIKAYFVSSENEMSTNNCCTISELQLRDEDSSGDASINYDVPCDVPGNFEQQTSKITYSKDNKMLFEDDVNNILHLNGDKLPTHVAPSQEIKNTNLFEGALCDISTSEHSASNNHIRDMPENKYEYLRMDDLQIDDAKECYSDILPIVEFQFNDNTQAMSENKDGNLDMDDAKEGSSDILPLVEVELIDNAEAMSENNDGNLDMDDAKEGSSDILPFVEVQLIDNIQAISENKDGNLDMDDLRKDDAKGSSDILPFVEVQLIDHIQAMSENKDGNHDMNNAKECSSDILPLVEVQFMDNIQTISENKDGNLDMDDLRKDDLKEGFFDILPLVEVQGNDMISSECNSSSEVNKGSYTNVVAWKSEERCSLSQSSNLPASDHRNFIQRIPKFRELSLLNRKNISDESEVSILEKNECPNTDVQHQHESAAKSKQEVLTGKLAPNAAPFTDEWFTAIKAAGEFNQNSPHGDWTETVSATACDTELRDDGSSRDASLHYHAHCEVPGNIDQQTSMTTYSKADEMLCEYKNSELNNDYLVDQTEFCEVSADFISNTKDSIDSGAEKPSGRSEHTLLVQFVQEFNHTTREIEESHLITQGQSLTENPVAYNCNSKQCLDVSDDKFPLADNDNINENSHLSDFQGPCAVVGKDSQNVDNIQHSDGDWLSTNIATSEHALEGCDIHTGEHNTSNDHIQVMPENENGNRYADERAEHLQMDDVKKGSLDILPLAEVQLNNNVASPECNSFIEVSKRSFTDVVDWKPEDHCSAESSSLTTLDNLTPNTRIQNVCEISLLSTKTFSEEAETNIFVKDEFPNTDMERQSKGDIYFAEDSDKINHLQESSNESEKEVPTVKPPPNAAPFSDEWLAAIEAAGEEMLTMKSGAVQNSPTDKPQLEPGPWSPKVRRRTQESAAHMELPVTTIMPSSEDAHK